MNIERRFNAGVPQDPDRDHFVDEDGNFDIVQFILQTTNEVWDQQRFDRIPQYFAEDFVSYGAEGREFPDLDALYDYALPRTAAFPDTKVFVDDLIWTGDEERGFRTSHSFTVTGTNTGASKHGPPTGKRLRLTGIANCKVEKVDGEWKYTEERAEDDPFAILRACTPGETRTYPDLPEDAAQGASDTVGDISDSEQTSTDMEQRSTDTADKYIEIDGAPSGFSPAVYLENLVDALWNDHSVGAIEEYYAEDVVVEAASGRRLRTTDELRTEVLERQGAFPDLEVTVDDMMIVDDGAGYNSSIAYTARGTHAGPSKYGSHSGKQVTFTGLLNQKLRKVGGTWRVVHCREDFDERRLIRMLSE